MCANNTDHSLNVAADQRECRSKAASCARAAGASAASGPDHSDVSGPDSRQKLGLFKRLLVAVDDSQQAGFAADVAASLAGQLGADVVLVTVFWVDRGIVPEMGF